MRRIAMTLVLLLAATELAAAARAPEQKLALKVMERNGAEHGAEALANVDLQESANSFAAGADLRDVKVDQKALRRAVRRHGKATRPKFVDATIGAYTTVYTPAELAQLSTWYRKSPKKRGKLDPALAGKFRQVAEVRAARLAPLRAELPGGLFEAYCARTRAACDAGARDAIARFGHL
jgi:hypothetical protein